MLHNNQITARVETAEEWATLIFALLDDDEFKRDLRGFLGFKPVYSLILCPTEYQGYGWKRAMQDAYLQDSTGTIMDAPRGRLSVLTNDSVERERKAAGAETTVITAVNETWLLVTIRGELAECALCYTRKTILNPMGQTLEVLDTVHRVLCTYIKEPALVALLQKDIRLSHRGRCTLGDSIFSAIRGFALATRQRRTEMLQTAVKVEEKYHALVSRIAQ